MAANLRTFAWSRAIIGSFELLVLPKSPLFTHNNKNGLLAPNQAAHQAQPNHAKALQGNNQAAYTQVDPISQEVEPHPP